MEEMCALRLTTTKEGDRKLRGMLDVAADRGWITKGKKRDILSGRKALKALGVLGSESDRDPDTRASTAGPVETLDLAADAEASPAGEPPSDGRCGGTAPDGDEVDEEREEDKRAFLAEMMALRFTATKEGDKKLRDMLAEAVGNRWITKWKQADILMARKALRDTDHLGDDLLTAVASPRLTRSQVARVKPGAEPETDDEGGGPARPICGVTGGGATGGAGAGTPRAPTRTAPPSRAPGALDAAASKPKRKAIPPAVRKAVWERYIGKQHGLFHCLVCKAAEITQMTFEVAHVVSVAHHGDNSVHNLRPICGPCNRGMSSMHMREYCERYPAGDCVVADCPCEEECKFPKCPCTATKAKANPLA